MYRKGMGMEHDSGGQGLGTAVKGTEMQECRGQSQGEQDVDYLLQWTQNLDEQDLSKTTTPTLW